MWLLPQKVWAHHLSRRPIIWAPLWARAQAPGPWTIRWTMDDGLWMMDYGRWTMDDGRWTIDRDRVMDDGRWIMDYGRWIMDDRLWIVG